MVDDQVSRTPYASDLDSQASYASARPTLDDDAALLTVAVPNDDAEVTVNGHPTTSDGPVRQFMSRGLKEGYIYTYNVNVKYTLDGKTVEDSKAVKLRPGDMERLVFEPSDASPSVKDQASRSTVDTQTIVEVHVPESATVTLAGNPTRGEGAVRVFRTKQLKAGERWQEYTIAVTTTIDGRSVSQQQTIDVEAGDHNVVTFDFDASTVAVR